MLRRNAGFLLALLGLLVGGLFIMTGMVRRFNRSLSEVARVLTLSVATATVAPTATPLPSPPAAAEPSPVTLRLLPLPGEQ